MRIGVLLAISALMEKKYPLAILKAASFVKSRKTYKTPKSAVY